MGDLDSRVKGIVSDALSVFDREHTAHSPRPQGIVLVGSSHRSEVLAAFRDSQYFTTNSVPVEVAEDSRHGTYKGYYSIDLNYCFRTIPKQ